MLLIAGLNFRRVVPVLQASCRRSVRAFSQEPDREKPVQFTTSEAASWRAEFTRSGNIYDDTPDVQPFVVSFSTGIFLWYFLWYREESDIDSKFVLSERSLFDQVPDMEEVTLKLQRDVMLQKGEDVREIEMKLKELERARLGQE